MMKVISYYPVRKVLTSYPINEDELFGTLPLSPPRILLLGDFDLGERCIVTLRPYTRKYPDYVSVLPGDYIEQGWDVWIEKEELP